MSGVLDAYELLSEMSPAGRSPRSRDSADCGHHAVVLRTGQQVDEEILDERLLDLMAGCPVLDEQEHSYAATRQPAAGSRYVWVEDLQYSADDPRTARMLHREVLRPVQAGLAMRLVILRSPDADQLIFAAHRRYLDRASLMTIARTVIQEPGDGEQQLWWDLSPAVQARQLESAPGTQEYWTLGGARSVAGGRSAVRLPVPAAGNDDGALAREDPRVIRTRQLAALAYTLMRYRGTAEMRIGVAVHRSRSPEILGAAEGIVPLTLRIDDGCVSDLLSRAGSVLDQATSEGTDGLEPMTPDVTVVFGADGEGQRDHEGQVGAPLGYEVAYFAGPRPDLPLVMQWLSPSRQPDHDAAKEAEVVCLFDVSRHGADMVEQFCRHVAVIYRQLADLPGCTPVDTLKLFHEDEATRIRVLGEGGELETERRCVHDAFRMIAADFPDSVAVSYKKEALTYQDLEIRSNRYANALRSMGVRVGDRVGVCMERSLSAIVTLLAVLKAGATYVPMDIGYPLERLAYMAEDSGLRLLISSDESLNSKALPIRVLNTADLAMLSEKASDRPVGHRTDPAQPAYIIYTSGSTGRPKGVAVPHQNLLSLIQATRFEMKLAANDVWSQFHSLAFDFSVWEIWGCLLTGGRLVVVPFFSARSPELFLELLESESITILNQTPSAFSELMRIQPASRPLSVRLLIFGGEALDTRLVRPWLDKYGQTGCRVVNMFGITETTVHATIQTVTRREALSGERSVGRPLNGWNLSIRDEQGRLLPPGVRGEVYVGGAGVALHYLNRPELTARHFIDDPHTGGRMYRSGDCGRLLVDGRIEHLGRLDNQVKIRGHRIELDEIRSVLLDDPALLEAFIVTGKDNIGGVRLDAYLVLRDDAHTAHAAAQIRSRAAKILPEYMVPSTWTPISQIPRTVNGKLDVSKLPAARYITSEGSGRIIDQGGPDESARSTGLLSTVCTAWGQVFGFAVRPDDDFFEMGGNSLLAIRLSAELRSHGLPSLHIRDLYRKPSPRLVAALIAE